MQGKTRFVVPVIGVALAAVLSAGRVVAADTFVRGDVDQSGRLDVSDAVAVLRFLFAGERDLVGCEDAADGDDSGVLDTSDAVFVLSALFRGGPAPAAPFPDCGEDPTDDALGCGSYDVCRFAFTFLGRAFAAEGVFFAVDRSGSMADTGELQRAEEELSRFIDAAPAGIRLGIVVFDAAVIRFPSRGTAVELTPEAREAASAFIASLTPGRASCIHTGLLATVDLARASGIPRSAIIHVGDGNGNCGEPDRATYLNRTLDSVTAANSGIARIHVTAAFQLDVLGERFLRDLASRNGGNYARSH